MEDHLNSLESVLPVQNTSPDLAVLADRQRGVTRVYNMSSEAVSWAKKDQNEQMEDVGIGERDSGWGMGVIGGEILESVARDRKIKMDLAEESRREGLKKSMRHELPCKAQPKGTGVPPLMDLVLMPPRSMVVSGGKGVCGVAGGTETFPQGPTPTRGQKGPSSQDGTDRYGPANDGTWTSDGLYIDGQGIQWEAQWGVYRCPVSSCLNVRREFGTWRSLARHWEHYHGKGGFATQWRCAGCPMVSGRRDRVFAHRLEFGHRGTPVAETIESKAPTKIKFPRMKPPRMERLQPPFSPSPSVVAPFTSVAMVPKEVRTTMLVDPEPVASLVEAPFTGTRLKECKRPSAVEMQLQVAEPGIPVAGKRTPELPGSSGQLSARSVGESHGNERPSSPAAQLAEQGTLDLPGSSGGLTARPTWVSQGDEGPRSPAAQLDEWGIPACSKTGEQFSGSSGWSTAWPKWYSQGDEERSSPAAMPRAGRDIGERVWGRGQGGWGRILNVDERQSALPQIGIEPAQLEDAEVLKRHRDSLCSGCLQRDKEIAALRQEKLSLIQFMAEMSSFRRC